jgi:hypothetical protein
MRKEQRPASTSLFGEKSCSLLQALAFLTKALILLVQLGKPLGDVLMRTQGWLANSAASWARRPRGWEALKAIGWSL